MRDVIIIGAGAGGSVVAKELAARGLDVLLLEAGPRFAEPEFEWSRFENEANNFFGGIFRFGPVDRSKPPWLRDLAQSSLVLQVAGVGGTTLVYAANSPRAMPGVFKDYNGSDKDAYDRAHEFPFSYRELIPYYEWVEHTLPVETAAMGTKEEVFFRGASKLDGVAVQTTKDITGDSFRPQENAILQPSGTAGKTEDRSKLVYPQAQGCTFCGHCNEGCVNPHAAPRNQKAKRSTANSYIQMALTADRWTHGKALTLITDAFAVGINTDQTEQQHVAKKVTWRIGATGKLVTEEAYVIVMAAGAIETPRLWLKSGLPNPKEPKDWVGRGLTYHFWDLVVGVMPFYTGSSKGPSSSARADFPGKGILEETGLPPAARAASLAVSESGIAGFYDNGRPADSHDADSVGRLVGRDLKEVLSDINKLSCIVAVTDDDVEYENRVMLSSIEDEHGPVARIELGKRSDRTVKNREFLVEKAVSILKLAGATKVYRMNWMPILGHMQSTMRMGLGEEDSVLDENAEARWVKRLFIADGSALANSLGGPNPALTIQALATRTAEKIYQLYFGGDPWVTREKPISSIDPVVTKAIMEAGRSCKECHGSNNPLRSG